MSNILSYFVDSVSEDLIIGNHETITLFGNELQDELRIYSEGIANILRRQEESDAVDKIENALSKIEDLINDNQKPFQKRLKYDDITERYQSILHYIERLKVYLQLQQASLLKDSSIFKQTQDIINDCKNSLSECIIHGESKLEECSLSRRASKPISVFDAGDDSYWIDRLEHRLQDLRISHTLAMQLNAQLLVLTQNNQSLIREISATVTRTIPIWKKQTVMLLGVEQIEQNKAKQNNLLKSVLNSLNGQASCKKIGHAEQEQIKELNLELKQTLSQVLELESENDKIRSKLMSLI